MLANLRNKINNFYLLGNDNFTFLTIALNKFLNGFYAASIGSLLVPIGEAFNIGINLQSIIFVFSYIGNIIFIFFIGYFADKQGKKIVNIEALLLLGIFALFLSKINNYLLFLILFIFMGIFNVSIDVLGDATVSDTFSKRKGFYLNITHAFFGLGAATLPVVFNLVYSKTGDFRTVYFILFIIAFLILLFVISAQYPMRSAEKIKLSIIISLMKNRNFFLLCIFTLFTFGTANAISGWIPTLFQKFLNTTSAFSNYSLSFFWMAIIIGRIVIAFILKKFKELTVLKTLNLIIFIILVIPFFLDNYLMLLINYLLIGLAFGGFIPLIMAYSSELFPKHSTTRIAVLFSFGSLGILIMPTLVGILATYFMINKIISFASIFFLAYVFIFHKYMR